MERAASILEWLVSLPEWLVYLLAGIAAAVENIIPPVPADVVILIAAVVAGAGDARPEVLFLAVWLGNVGSALLVYMVGRRHGIRLFEGRLGQFLLAPAQLAGLARAYERFGFAIIFFSRFLPVFRPVVPVFAGIAQLSFIRTAIPIGLASGIWYGLLVYLGSVAGSNWPRMIELLGRAGAWLWLLAGVLIALVVAWWFHGRRTALAGDES